LPLTDETRVKTARSVVAATLAGAVVSLALHVSGFRLLRITSGSMAPAVEVGNLVIAREHFTDAQSLARGSIVVFRFPFGSDLRAIKRVVALPGDVVEVRSDAVIINGQRMPAASAITTAARLEQVPPYAIALGTMFLLGDNSAHSIDSRSFGPVAEREILGKVVLVLPAF
jgi:signal peptidase I